MLCLTAFEIKTVLETRTPRRFLYEWVRRCVESYELGVESYEADGAGSQKMEVVEAEVAHCSLLTAHCIRYRRPWLADYQTEFMDHPARYAVVEAATKTGKTTACLVWLIEQAGRAGSQKLEDVETLESNTATPPPQRGGSPTPNWPEALQLITHNTNNYWWVAPVRAQARMAFSRAWQMLQGWPGVRKHETDLRITMPNGARLWFRTAEKPDNLYGEDVHAVVVDEATRCRPAAWHAIRSTITATGGRVRIIGNVKGNRNWVRALALRAQAENNAGQYAFFRITAWDAMRAGFVTEQEIEDARDTLPPGVFRELYEALPADDEGNPFGGRAALEQSVCAPNGLLPPEAQARFFGVDLGKSHDYTVVVGLDDYGRVAYFDRFRQPWPATLMRIAAAIGPQWALADSTGVGDAIVEQLSLQLPLLSPFVFTATSKQQLMEQLAVALQQHDICLPPADANPILAELEVFEYRAGPTGRIQYAAPAGFHDDCVCALALAFRCYAQNRYRASGFDYVLT